VHNAESKIAYCITCEVSVGNPIQAAAHYRSREHFNRRLQRGLPVTELPSAEQDQSTANPADRHYINDCLRRGVSLPQPGSHLYFIYNYMSLMLTSVHFLCYVKVTSVYLFQFMSVKCKNVTESLFHSSVEWIFIGWV